MAAEAVKIARCPIHGLHGDREECYVCGGPVEQVLMVPTGPDDDRVTDQEVADDLNRLAAATDVRWDRIVDERDHTGQISVYGWLSRSDGRADFLVMRYWPGGSAYLTSSVAIDDTFGGKDAPENTECERVEHRLPGVEAAIRLGRPEVNDCVVVEGELQIGNHWAEDAILIDGKLLARHLRQHFPKTDNPGAVRITIEALASRGEDDRG